MKPFEKEMIGEKKKIEVASTLSFSHKVFCPIKEEIIISLSFNLLLANSFNLDDSLPNNKILDMAKLKLQTTN